MSVCFLKMRKYSPLRQRPSLIRLLVSLIVFALFGWYIATNWASFSEIRLTGWRFLVPAVLFYILNVLFMGLLVEQAMKPHGAELRVREAFGLSALTRFSKQFAPGYLGSALRAAYYKKNFEIPYTKFSSSLVLSTLLQLMVSGLLAVLTYSVLVPGLNITWQISTILFGISAATIALYAPLSLARKAIKYIGARYPNKIIKQLLIAVDEYLRVRKQPKFIYWSTAWALLALLSSAGALYFYYLSLGTSVGVTGVVFISCLTSWTTLFSITPSDIGVREGLMVFGAKVAGIPISVTLAAAILLRVVQFVIVALLASYYGPKLAGDTLKESSPST